LSRSSSAKSRNRPAGSASETRRGILSDLVARARELVVLPLRQHTHKELVEIEKQIRESTAKHNAFLKELGLSPLPAADK
jgi:hypothetical protein